MHYQYLIALHNVPVKYISHGLKKKNSAFNLSHFLRLKAVCVIR